MTNYEKYFGSPEKASSSLSNDEMYKKVDEWAEEHSLVAAVNTMKFCVLAWLQEETE